MYNLLHNPDKLERVVTEIRTAFENYSDINWQKAQQLRYVQAVINESLRMIPPAPSGLGLPRVSPGFELHGKYIPPGVCRTPLLQTKSMTDNYIRSKSSRAHGL